MKFWTAHRLALIVLATGCRNVVDIPPSPARIPVIEGLLIADSTNTTLRLIWADTLGRLGDEREPIAPADVFLTLSDQGGTPVGLTARRDTVALFQVALKIRPGQRYRLSGTIAGRPVSATTVIPGPFTIDAPADRTTVRFAVPVPFRWRASGATTYASAQAIFGQGGYSHTADTVGQLNVRPEGVGEPSTLIVWAMNRDVQGYLYNLQVPQSNIVGATGMLGGATVTRKAISWQ